MRETYETNRQRYHRKERAMIDEGNKEKLASSSNKNTAVTLMDA
jgi:hypothetical protein